ncbi:N utilization substance protein B [Chitinivorax tropicus]|uniref:Transcription antitermination protein NusB n=1 Tax=Chitinivorax tropicus TaxID=714531 RepID=A0A840MUZ5_9PROT|nr:transcription antitermination factor NusB [Chitinivorax tropicus]MBB5020176.1 N utilization substance protein B [Chitinivorax tropicus]
MKSARRKAREFAVQGLYQWQLTQDPPTLIEKNLAENQAFEKCDLTLFRAVLFGAISHADTLRSAMSPYLERDWDDVSPVERGVLLVAGFELVHMPETPFPVIINEAIELSKTFGGNEGHKFINGVLDKFVEQVRAAEAQNVRNQRGQRRG